MAGWQERFFARAREAVDWEVETPSVEQFALSALEKHKAEGMRLAVKARFIALGVIAVLLVGLVPRWDTLYYLYFLVLFALIGWAQLRVAKVGRSWVEFLLLSLDLFLLAFTLLVPNPFSDLDLPLAMQYRFNGHIFFFVFLALGTLAYSSRTVRAFGTVGGIAWLGGLGFMWLFASDHWMIEPVRKALEPHHFMEEILDPAALRMDLRVQEIVVFGLVAFILSMTSRRFSDLLLEHASSERARTNLSRYFSPNMVDNLSQNDDPLKMVRTQNVAVLFVDIVGFTTYSDSKNPDEVIKTLREFHAMMERCVFKHEGTLDKFLGDGLMATFGTPIEGEQDAINALECAKDMAIAVNDWNKKRVTENQPEIKVGVGVHYGPCVLGDIGGENRLEFAVVGDTVNVASRVEAKTRELDVDIAFTDAVASQVSKQAERSNGLLDQFAKFEGQQLKGLKSEITLHGARLRG